MAVEIFGPAPESAGARRASAIEGAELVSPHEPTALPRSIPSSTSLACISVATERKQRRREEKTGRINYRCLLRSIGTANA
jgi:hypothetical protein